MPLPAALCPLPVCFRPIFTCFFSSMSTPTLVPSHSVSLHGLAPCLPLAMCSAFYGPEVVPLIPANPIQGHNFCQHSPSSPNSACFPHRLPSCSSLQSDIDFHHFAEVTPSECTAGAPHVSRCTSIFSVLMQCHFSSSVSPLVSFFPAFSFVCFQPYIVMCIFCPVPFFSFP